MLNEKSRFKKTGLLALLAIVGFSDGWAGTVTNYTIGDVLVCFRKGGNDMVVDAGPISAFTGAAANQRIPITQYTGAQLAQVGTNSVSWSAFAWLGDNTLFCHPGPGLPGHPDDTLAGPKRQYPVGHRCAHGHHPARRAG